MSCVKRGVICIPKGDGRKVVATAWDRDGDEVDISGATAIDFIVAIGQKISTNMWSGGDGVIVKRLGSGITKAGNAWQFIITFLPEDTADLIMTEYYWEARVTIGDMPVTVGCGSFLTQNTQIKDLV